MPLRIMSWNIQRFSRNTLERDLGHNLHYILSTVQQVHVFSLLEVQVTKGPVRGTVIRAREDGDERVGVLELLAHLRNLNSNWCLVPPVRVNDSLGNEYCEAMAVYFRSDIVQFVGPYYFRGEANPVGPRAQDAVPYPADWAECLPAGNKRAPRLIGLKGASRSLQLTDFLDVANKRTLRLFAAHLTPSRGGAGKAPGIGELCEALGREEFTDVKGDDVAVLTGDFNVNWGLREGARDINLCKDGCSFQGFETVDALKKFPTLIERTDDASLEKVGTDGADGGLYRYQLKRSEYSGGGGKRPKFDPSRRYLDNVYVRHGKRQSGRQFNPLVVDRVQAVDGYPTTMYNTLADLETILDINDQNEQFRRGINYGHIGPSDGVSDHLPIVIDIP